MKPTKKKIILDDFQRFLYHESLQHHCKQDEIKSLIKESE